MRTRTPSRTLARRLAGLALAGTLAGSLAGMLAACGGPAPSTSPASSGSPASPAAPATDRPPATGAVDPTPIATAAPELTPVPGVTDEPIPPPGDGGTTVIEWGTILDQVPDGFPVFPGSMPTQVDDGPASGAWFVEGAGVDGVATWYRDQLEALGFSTKDLSSPLEDGTRILDTVSDLPECRIQTTFRPAGGSTIIIVLYGAGCAGGDG